MEGKAINTWKDAQLNKFRSQIIDKGVERTDEDLWTNFRKDFILRFGDNAAKEKALQAINQLVQKDDVDLYITDFNNLVSKLG